MQVVLQGSGPGSVDPDVQWCEIMAQDFHAESKAAPAATGGLEGLTQAARAAGAEQRRLPPVHLWNPPFCGDLDMRIARDGTWFYNGTPIGRPALVRLFSTILRKDEDAYVLVTPVEKVGIKVEDAPFLAVELAQETRENGQALKFRTNVDDWVEAGPDHPMRFEMGEAEGLKPYVHVRADLWALVKRALFYDLVDLGEKLTIEGEEMFGITSNGAFFPMMRADQLDALS
ncbi:MAG: uncharacterized protein QOC72_537 [Methylobacteriaceae bacterium]|nr:uncharacterized protein [Methylobacteriaceae bacterium]